jgi:hypothetical protein
MPAYLGEHDWISFSKVMLVASTPAHLLFLGCQNMGAMKNFTSHGSDRVEGFSFGSFLGGEHWLELLFLIPT